MFEPSPGVVVAVMPGGRKHHAQVHGDADHSEDYIREPTLTPPPPARALDTSFQPNTTRPVFGIYTVRIACDPGETGEVELRSDASDPPTTVRAAARMTLGGILAVSTVGDDIPICYIVPAGHFVELVTSGAATITLQHQTEETL